MGALQARLEELQDDVESDAVYVVGDDTEYGIFLEMGTRKMQPYPWFKPAIREFKANPEPFILDNTGYASIDDIPSADALVQAVANALARQMEKNVSAETATDRSPGTHPEHPQEQLGNLKGSIAATQVK